MVNRELLKRNLVAPSAGLPLKSLPTPACRALGWRTITAVRRYALPAAISLVLAAVLSGSLGTSSSAWAKSNRAAPTVHFQVKHLEVEAQKGGETPSVVVVRNKNDQDDALDFFAEVLQGGGRATGAGSSAPSASQEKATLSFLGDPLDLALKPIEEFPTQDANNRACSADAEKMRNTNADIAQARTTVFVSVDSVKDLTDLGFQAKVRPQRAGLRTGDSYIQGHGYFPISVCWHDPVNGQDKSIKSSNFKPFDVSFVVKDPARRMNLWKTGMYLSRKHIPSGWSSLSGHLAVVSDQGQANIDTLTLRLSGPGPGYDGAFSRIWKWATGFFLSLLASLIIFLVLLQHWREKDRWKPAIGCSIVTLAVLFALPVFLERSRLGDLGWKWGMVMPLSVIVGILVYVWYRGREQTSTKRAAGMSFCVVVGLVTALVLLQWLLGASMLGWSVGYALFASIGFWAFYALYKRWRTDNAPVKRWLRTEFLFDIKTGWGSNLTVVATIVGTVLAAGVLPQNTFFISKEQYISLNMTFGIALLIITVMQSMMPRGWTYVPACAATLGVAFGELIVTLLLIKEIALQENIPPRAAQFLQAGFVVISAAVTVYAFAKIYSSIKSTERLIERPPAAEEPSPTVGPSIEDTGQSPASLERLPKAELGLP